VPLPPKQENICTITQLTSGIKRILEDSYPAVWVKGEVSNLRQQSSGHLYFSLKDEGAQISAVMFKGNAMRLGMPLRDGMEVISLGNLSVYEPRGTYQLIVRECIEEGAGRLQAEFERLKRLLDSEGLFSPDRKKPLPLLPRRVGIITSPTGAALRDFLSILRRRNWTGTVVLFPAVVQGKEGGPDILQKLQWAQAYGDLDLLVIGRGGGSIEDLWNFNEEAVVRAVAACDIPIVSAVGHEIDFVLTDFAADKRAETPSAAAELISSGYVDIRQRLQQAGSIMRRIAIEQMRNKSQWLAHASDRLRAHTPARFVENRHLRLDELQQRMQSHMQANFSRHSHEIAVLEERFKNLHPVRSIETQRQRLISLEQRFGREIAFQITSRNQQLASMEKRFSSLSFENVLKRGYALVRDERGNVVTGTNRLKHGKRIEIQLHDGRKKAIVHDIEQMDLFG